MATSIDLPSTSPSRELSFDELSAPLPDSSRLGGEGPFVINLHASSAPMDLPDIELGEPSRARVYRIQRLEDGRKRYRLRVGPFLREEEADAALSRVRDIYPGALTATAVAEDLSVFATIRVKADLRQTAVQATQPPHAVAPRAALATALGPAPAIDRVNAATAPALGAGRTVDQAVLVPNVPLLDASPVGEPSIAVALVIDNAPAPVPVPFPALEFPELTLVDPPPAPAEASTDASPGAAEAPTVRTPPRLDATFDALSASLSLVATDAPQTETEQADDYVTTSGAKSGAHSGDKIAKSAEQADNKAGMKPAERAGEPFAAQSGARADKKAESKPVGPPGDALAVRPDHKLSATSAAQSVAQADESAAGKAAPTPHHKLAIKPSDKASAVSGVNPAGRLASGNGAKANIKLVAKQQVREDEPAPRTPAPAASAGLDADLLPEIELNLETTQTLRPLTSRELEDAKALRWFVVELCVSDRAFDPSAVPKLDIFLLYRLYSVASMDQGRHVHALRLGFFGEEIAASAVANYLMAYYDKATVKRVSVAERERFSEQGLEARKEVGETGQHAVIELSGERAPPKEPLVRPAAAATATLRQLAGKPVKKERPAGVLSSLLGIRRRK